MVAPHAPRVLRVPFEALKRAHREGASAGLIALLNKEHLGQLGSANGSVEDEGHILVVCRRGVDSEEVTHLLLSAGLSGAVNVEGGLAGWGEGETCPTY
jgi:hypothetical protein